MTLDLNEYEMIKVGENLLLDCIDWLESCVIWQGEMAGQNLRLAPFQIELIRQLLDPNNSRIMLSIPRNNGKTTTAGAIAGLYVDGPLAVPNTDIAIAAADKAQAALTVKHCWQFLRPEWESNPQRFKFNDNKQNCEIIDRWNNITVTALSSAPQSKHGKASQLIILDEPAQYSEVGGEKLYNAMVGGMGKTENAKMLIIGTLPDSEEHWFYRDIKLGTDPEARKGTGIYGMIYKADDGAEYDDIEQIRKANPMWNYAPELQKLIFQEIEMIKKGGLTRSYFEAYKLNMGVPETDLIEWILGKNTKEQWQACERFDLPKRNGDVFLGIDIGEAKSLTGAALYWPEAGINGDQGRLEVYAGLPAEPSLREKANADRVPGLYQAAYDCEELETFNGTITDVKSFIEWIIEKLDGQVPKKIIADSYKQNQVKQFLKAACPQFKIDDERFMEFRRVGRGKDGASDLINFQKECYENYLKCKPSPLMRSALRDAQIIRDTNGNGAVDKSRNRGRIDVLQASLLAVGAGRRHRLPEPDTDLMRPDGLKGYIF